MAAPALEIAPPPPPSRRRRGSASTSPGPLGAGLTVLWLSIVVLLPLAALLFKAADASFWDAVTNRAALSALKFTLVVSLLVAALNAVFGTLTAWVLVRDQFRGKQLVNTLIDLPFALPTIVAGITLLALYGPNSPVGVDLAYKRVAVLMALMFVTLPFVVRAVQPVVMELDREMEEAAVSLGASGRTTFLRIILPNLVPAILSGAALSFARAVGEFGSVVLISGNRAFDTQVSSVYIFSQVESDNTTGAAAVAVVLLGISLAILIGIRGLDRLGGARRAH